MLIGNFIFLRNLHKILIFNLKNLLWSTYEITQHIIQRLHYYVAKICVIFMWYTLYKPIL